MFHFLLEIHGHLSSGFELGSVVVVISEAVVEHESNISDNLSDQIEAEKIELIRKGNHQDFVS